MDLGKILGSQQAYNWLGQFGSAIAPEGSGAARLGDAATGITAGQIEQEARKKAEKEQKKKARTAMIGQFVGNIANTVTGNISKDATNPTGTVQNLTSTALNSSGQPMTNMPIQPMAEQSKSKIPWQLFF